VTLRESLGDDVRRIYEQVDALLDSEDGLLVLFDGGRMVSYTKGFGMSASQLELLSVELERAVRNGVGRQPMTNRKKRRDREQDCLTESVTSATSTKGQRKGESCFTSKMNIERTSQRLSCRRSYASTTSLTSPVSDGADSPLSRRSIKFWPTRSRRVIRRRGIPGSRF
jgi:hypothetical protein